MIRDPHLLDPPPQNVASIFKVTSQSKMTAGTPAVIFILQARRKCTGYFSDLSQLPFASISLGKIHA